MRKGRTTSILRTCGTIRNPAAHVTRRGPLLMGPGRASDGERWCRKEAEALHLEPPCLRSPSRNDRSARDELAPGTRRSRASQGLSLYPRQRRCHKGKRSQTSTLTALAVPRPSRCEPLRAAASRCGTPEGVEHPKGWNTRKGGTPEGVGLPRIVRRAPSVNFVFLPSAERAPSNSVDCRLAHGNGQSSGLCVRHRSTTLFDHDFL